MSIGVAITMPNAQSRPQSIPLCVTSAPAAIGSVEVCGPPSEDANAQSFHANTMHGTAVVIKPGLVTGTATFQNARILLQPSTMAASSMDRGTWWKNAFISQMA